MQRILLCLLLLAGLGLLLAGPVLANPDQFALDWWTVDTGGGVSQGGSFTLNGSLGQADAGALQGGSYALQGGFWPSSSSVERPFKIMLPVVVHP